MTRTKEDLRDYMARICVNHWQIWEAQQPHPQGGNPSRFGFRMPRDCDDNCRVLWFTVGPQ